MATRYLKQRGTGIIFVRTPILAARPDMEPYKPPKGSELYKRSLIKRNRAAPVQAQPPEMNAHRNKPDNWGQEQVDDGLNEDEDEGDTGADAAEDSGEGEDAGENTAVRSLIAAAKTKEALEEIGRDYLGIELDRRKKVDTLRDELFAAADEQGM